MNQQLEMKKQNEKENKKNKKKMEDGKQNSDINYFIRRHGAQN